MRVCVCRVSRMDALVSHSRPLCMPVAVARERPASRSVTFNLFVFFFFLILSHCVRASFKGRRFGRSLSGDISFGVRRLAGLAEVNARKGAVAPFISAILASQRS